MRLFEGSTQQFIQDTIQNKIADELKNAFEAYYMRKANPKEVMSWTNSAEESTFGSAV